MKFILGEKIAMTQLWQNDRVVPVTKIAAGPCTVLQIKTVEQDGYRAVQVGYGDKKAKNISKPLLGHFKDNGHFRYVKEFRLALDENIGELKVGDQISVLTFQPGDRLTITGLSKGKGFQGSVKRHGFHGQDATHGNKDQLRASGSIGAGGVQHVFKGTRMPGRMGGEQVTRHDVEIIEVNEQDNSLFIKGPLPGARHSLVLLSSVGELKLGLPEIKVAKAEEVAEVKVAEPKTEEPKEEAKPEEAPVEEKPVEEEKVVEAKPEEVKEEPKTEEALPA